MHHRQDVDAVGVNSIEKAIRKLWDQDPSEAVPKSPSDRGLLDESLIRVLNDTYELAS